MSWWPQNISFIVKHLLFFPFIDCMYDCWLWDDGLPFKQMSFQPILRLSGCFSLEKAHQAQIHSVYNQETQPWLQISIREAFSRTNSWAQGFSQTTVSSLELMYKLNIRSQFKFDLKKGLIKFTTPNLVSCTSSHVSWVQDIDWIDFFSTSNESLNSKVFHQSPCSPEIAGERERNNSRLKDQSAVAPLYLGYSLSPTLELSA